MGLSPLGSSSPLPTLTWTLCAPMQVSLQLLFSWLWEGDGRVGSERLVKEMLVFCFAAKRIFPKALSFFQIKKVFVWF